MALCACGCGRDAGVYRKSGVAGFPRTYIHGHNTRKPLPETKVCSRCLEDKSADEFYFAESVGYQRLSSRCKLCTQDSVAEWINSNPDRRRMTTHNATTRYRMRLEQQFIEPVDPARVYQMYGGMCGICKEFIDLSEHEMHVDHIVPISKGGAHGYVNVQPAHAPCNLKKNAKELV